MLTLFFVCKGGLIGAYTTSGTFKPVHSVLQELTPIEREKLYRSITSALGDVHMLDLAALAALIATDQVYKQQMVGAMMEYFRNEFKMEIVE